MKACVLKAAKTLSLEEIPTPNPTTNEVLIELGAGGICGSDLHYFQEGGVGDFRLREPLIPGHEVSGKVIALGSGVTCVKVGDRVAVNPNHPCGKCAQCLTGLGNMCSSVRFFGSAARFPHIQGAFAEFFTASENNCFKIPDEVSYREAACAEPLAVTLHAVSQAGPIQGKKVIITGSGPIGVLLIAAAKRAGAAHICITDVQDEPLRIAQAMGANEIINITKNPEQLHQYQQNRGYFDTAFEASGHPAALATLIEVSLPGSTIVQVGMLPRGLTQAPLNPLVSKEIKLVGSFRFDKEYVTAVNAITRGEVNLKPMLTHEFSFTELNTAFSVALDKKISMKVSLHP